MLIKKPLCNGILPPAQLKGATIILSNFGKFSGRFASPIVVSPMVAILGVGKLYKGVVVNQDDQLSAIPCCPCH